MPAQGNFCARNRAGELTSVLPNWHIGAMPDPLPVAEPDLVRHVITTTGLSPATAIRVVADVVAYFDETVDEYVRRRHHELRLRQLKNAQIWPALAGGIST